jgi:hypothetical protein
MAHLTTTYAPTASIRQENDPRKGYLGDWLVRIDKSALYCVQSEEQTDSKLQLVAAIPYRDMLLREQMVYVHKRPLKAAKDRAHVLLVSGVVSEGPDLWISGRTTARNNTAFANPASSLANECSSQCDASRHANRV